MSSSRRATKIERLRDSSPSAREGFALIGAIAMLALFAMLGTAYVRFMMIEVDDTSQELDVLRAEYLATGGIYAAIGEIEYALAEGAVPDAEFSLPANVYRYEGGKQVARVQDVTVTVSDEAARLNLNHTPPQVLRALGLDDGELRRLENALPTSSGLRSESRRWLNNVDELLTRGIVSRRDYDRLDRNRFTIHTVADADKPTGFINLNAAEPVVLGAIFGLHDTTEIGTLAASRPFASWQDVLTKTGREPSTFNVAPPRYASREMPSALALTSRCYRLRSEVGMNYRGARGRTVSAAVEAVVLFHENGTYSIRYWNGRPDVAADDAMIELEIPVGTGAEPEAPPAAGEAQPASSETDETAA